MTSVIFDPELTDKELKSFMSKIDKSGACWEWLGGSAGNGYGSFSVRRGDKYRVLLAHRVSLVVHCGPFPGEMCVLHSCNNPTCVRPDHLRVGTHQENMRDKVAARTQKSGVLTDYDRIDIAYSDVPIAVLAKKYNISRRMIVYIRRDKKDGKIPKHI